MNAQSASVPGPVERGCRGCGGPLRTRFEVARDPLTGEAFRVDSCERCGLGHTVPQPADLGRYYVEPYYGNRHGFTLRHCMDRRLRFVAASVGAGRKGRVLDVGCGDGTFLLCAREAGWEVAGTEINPEPARANGLQVWGALEHVPLDPLFDCVTMWHTLEHMLDPLVTLAGVRDRLKPGGSLVVAVPDWGGLQARLFRERWLHLDVPRHLFHFTPTALERCLERAGFSVERRWHQEFEYDLQGWSQSALNWVMGTPNAFFNCLTGKGRTLSPGAKATALTLGPLLSVAALPFLALGTALGRGGTLVVACRRSGNPP